MATRDVERKLTAILSADVAGYSRLMGADEEATVATLTAYRKVFVSEIENHHGRVVDAKGDAILAEFASVVDAVKGAVEIQRELAEKNAGLPDDRRMDFRIGINLGDVLVKDDAIYGDGVNIASRVESLAEGGGICISGSAYAQVRNKLKLEYEFLGKKEVKNIDQPVPVYRVLSVPGAAAHRVVGAKAAQEGRWRRTALVLAAGLVLVVGLIAAGYFLQSGSAPQQAATAPIPAKPSVAVLAFANMSGDPEQEIFSDGISETIITRLSRLPGLFVISRTSSFSYKGKPVTVRQVGRELGVRFVLEGSVQKAGNRVRITAQLIEGATGNHIWAESYERDLTGTFALQDEIVAKIVTALEVQLTMDEAARVHFRSTENLEAWQYYLRGVKLLRGATYWEKRAAKPEFEKALELDPDFAAALLGLGWNHYEVILGRGGQPAAKFSLDKATELATRAITLDPSLAEPYALLGSVHFLKKNYDLSIRQLQRAVALEPGVAEWKMRLAAILSWMGEPEQAHAVMKQALRLDPFPAEVFLESWCRILYQTGRYQAAIRVANNILNRTPERAKARIILIASYSASGRIIEARAEFEKYKRIAGSGQGLYPQVAMRLLMHFVDSQDAQRMIDDLNKVGLPE